MTELWKSVVIGAESSLLDAINVLNKTGLETVLVCDEDNRFLGTVTDGDIRKGLVRGVVLTDPISSVFNENASSVTKETDQRTIRNLFKNFLFKAIPIVDARNHLVGCHFAHNYGLPEVEMPPLLIMAGGFGTRFGDLTKSTPKPLLKIRGKPIIEHIIDTAIDDGIKKIVISVHYLAEQIKNYFGDGSGKDIEITYINEKQPLGTAGSFQMIEQTSGPVIVTNGDIISFVGYRDLLDFHQCHDATATMAVCDHEIRHQFGVVKINDIDLVGFEEKPIWKTKINAGIYVIDASSKAIINSGEAIQMPALFERIRYRGGKTIAFPIHEKWFDIGNASDLKAQQ